MRKSNTRFEKKYLICYKRCIQIFTLVVQIEHELITLRTKEALYARKQADVKLGSSTGKGKSKLDAYHDEIVKLIALGVPKTMIAKQYNCTVGNFYHYLKYDFWKYRN